MVEHALGLDPFARAVYVFRNRRTDRLKLLLWERNGFWLLLRRFGGDISRNTLAASVIRVGQASQPVINLMRDVLLDSGVT
ncbi:IS66 family insertion sequence element accessory protein TnpB, partial [Burkholderia cenocepacia]|uniref:IS66 family insertion sequence element accessory protein TnpB n=1 Tax=Burkholderia cenocepacia TaxID=95486 RepID=UPI002B2495E2